MNHLPTWPGLTFRFYSIVAQNEPAGKSLIQQARATDSRKRPAAGNSPQNVERP